MRAHTNIKLKDRNSLTISNFKGVDFSSSAVNVQSNRSSYMRNLINEGGVNKKRNGWNELKVYTEKINGIYEAPMKRGMLVHAGTKIYWDSNRSVLVENVQNKRSQAFYKDDKVYIVCGDIYVFKYAADTGVIATRLLDSDEIYIPTTTISIDNDTVTDTVRATLDDINCLTKWRKNTLVGVVSENKEAFTQGDWTLDASIDDDTDITIEMEIQAGKNAEGMFVTKTIVAKSYGVSDDYQGQNTYYEIKDEKNTLIGIVNKKLGKIRIFTDTTPPIDNQANITVTFAHTHRLASKITNCTFGTVFGVNGNTDTLFLSGNINFPNVCFYSAEDDFTYFPNRNVIAMGSETHAIGGFARLSDSTLVAVKEGVSHEAGIYYITGSYQPINDEADARLVAPVYTRTAGGIGEGITSRYCNANLNGDALILTQSGVQGIVLGENVARTERFTRNRSVNINGKLLLHSNLSNAVAICHNNRYYLAIDGVCYVADARHKFIPNDTVDNSFNYEWWFWDNIPARVWASIDGKLYFGTEQGQICVFDDKYTDRVHSNIKDGSMIDFNNEQIVYDMHDYIQDGDTINIATQELYVMLQAHAEMNDFEIKTDSIFNFHDGEKVWIEKNGTYSEYSIGDVDWAKNTYSLCAADGFPVEIEGMFNVLLNVANRDLYIVNVDTENNTFQVKLNKDGGILDLYSGTPSESDIVTYSRNVVAEYHTPVFDFGTIESSKTLLKMSVAVEPQLSGELAFGYETRNVYKMLNVKGIRRFTFDDFNFNDFSFDTEFNNSYSVRVNERNFNYIMFRFVSDSDTDCIINKFTAIYKINKSNRGVR